MAGDTLLTYPDSNENFKIHTDASAVGSDISQRRFPKDDVTGCHGGVS